jgi:hypothetical protein
LTVDERPDHDDGKIKKRRNRKGRKRKRIDR